MLERPFDPYDIAERPSVLAAFRGQLARGVTYYREPSPESTDDPAVHSVGIVRLRVNHYRAVILYRERQPDGNRLFACETDKIGIVRWLSTHGLPTVRLIRADF